MAFATVAYWLAAFLTIYGLVALWISYKSPKKAGFFSPRGIGFMFALLYFGLAHFSILTGLSYGVELNNEAPCENIIDYENVTGNVTTYTYVDSCANRSTPQAVQFLLVSYYWLLFIDLAAMFLGFGFFTIWRAFAKW